MTRVYPIPGLLAVGFPDTEHDVEDEDDLEAHLASGAFALSGQEALARSPLTDPVAAPVKQPKSKEK